MVNVIGNATAMMPVNEEVIAQRREEARNFYDGVSQFLEQRGSQPLSTSVYAGQPGGSFRNRKPFKRYNANGGVYRNIAIGYKGNNGRSHVANAPSMTNSSVASPKAVVLNAKAKSFVSYPKAAPVVNGQTKSIAAPPKAAPANNAEAKPFGPAKQSSGHYAAGLATPDEFMASAREHLKPTAGTPSTASGVKTETKSFVAPPKAASVVNGQAKSFVAPPKVAPVANAEVKFFVAPKLTPIVHTKAKSAVPATRPSAGNSGLVSNDVFMRSARNYLNQDAGTPNAASANTETKSLVDPVKTASDDSVEAKHVANPDTPGITTHDLHRSPSGRSKCLDDWDSHSAAVDVRRAALAARPERVVYTESVNYPPSRAASHYARLANNKEFMASVHTYLKDHGFSTGMPADRRHEPIVAKIKICSRAKKPKICTTTLTPRVADTTTGDEKTEFKSVVDTTETTSNVSIEAKPAANTPAAHVNIEVSEHAAGITTGDDKTEIKSVVETVSNVSIETKLADDTGDTIVTVANTEVTPNVASGVNPEAKPFIPAARFSDGNAGLVSGDQFMASARKFLAGGGLGFDKYRKSATTSGASSPSIKPRGAPARVLLFKNVPDWLNIPDVLGFVYGGAVDCIFRSNMAEITVQFCDEAACMAYLEAHPNGISVQNPGQPDETVIIDVEKAPRGEEVSPALQMKIATGSSRLVRVDGTFDAEKLQALTARAMEYEVDHVMFRTEKNKMGSVYIFFCSLADGWDFKRKLQEDEAWSQFVALFMADPCKVATAFHDNTIPNRMASAVAV